MRSDEEIKRDVEAELNWDPGLEDASDIAIAVQEGVVRLTGVAHSWADRKSAESAAKRVKGVRGLANDLQVRIRAAEQRTNPEIARDAVAAIRNAVPAAAAENIRVVVKDGRVTLEGSVEWHHHRTSAEEAVRSIKGIRHVRNSLVVTPKASAFDIKKKIEDALVRSAQVDAARITVEANGTEITLRGNVKSWAEFKDAEDAAWAAPGVSKVENRIAIDI